jgi:hypothetical protein
MNKKAKAYWDSKWNLVLKGIGNDFVNELVRVAPVDTGYLRNSIRYEVKGKSVDISMAEYGFHLEFGTRPHVIRPVNAKSLHWKQGGRDVFAKVVYHPGTEAKPFIRSTINSKLRNIVYNNIKEVMA